MRCQYFFFFRPKLRIVEKEVYFPIANLLFFCDRFFGRCRLENSSLFKVYFLGYSVNVGRGERHHR